MRGLRRAPNLKVWRPSSDYRNYPAQDLYVLRDSFVTDDAAPIASPRNAEPGPGVTHITGATGALTGGKYSNDIAAVSEGPYYNTGFVRVAGLATVVRGVSLSRLTSLIDWGFAASAGHGASSGRPLGQANGSNIQGSVAAAAVAMDAAPSLSTNYDFAAIADTDGGYILWKLSTSSLWTLAGVVRGDATTPIFSRYRINNAAGVADSYEVLYCQLPPKIVDCPTARDVGIIPLVHGADFVAELQATTTGTQGIKFRFDGSGDYFTAERTATAARVQRYDSGTPTVVLTAAITAAIGDRVFVRLDGNSVRAYAISTGAAITSVGTATITQHATKRGLSVIDPANFANFYAYNRLQSILPAA